MDSGINLNRKFELSLLKVNESRLLRADSFCGNKIKGTDMKNYQISPLMYMLHPKM